MITRNSGSTLVVFDRTSLDSTIAAAMLGTHMDKCDFTSNIVSTDYANYLFIGVTPDNNLVKALRKKNTITMEYSNTSGAEFEYDVKRTMLIDLANEYIIENGGGQISPVSNMLSSLIWVYMWGNHNLSIHQQSFVYSNFKYALRAINGGHSFEFIDYQFIDHNEYDRMLFEAKEQLSRVYAIQKVAVSETHELKVLMCNVSQDIMPIVMHLGASVYDHVLAYERIRGKFIVNLSTTSQKLRESVPKFFSKEFVFSNQAVEAVQM